MSNQKTIDVTHRLKYLQHKKSHLCIKSSWEEKLACSHTSTILEDFTRVL